MLLLTLLVNILAYFCIYLIIFYSSYTCEQLNFEDGRGGLQIVRVELLRDLLRAGGLKLDFVFVSACHSRRTGEAFIDAGVPHVVCVKVDAMVSKITHIKLFKITELSYFIQLNYYTMI